MSVCFFPGQQSMGEDPTRMHSHVMRTMFSHAQCYNIFGPVFFQIKKALAPQWMRPHSLQQLCRKSIRGSLFRGCQRNAHPETVAALRLPKPLESFVTYHGHSWTGNRLFRHPSYFRSYPSPPRSSSRPSRYSKPYHVSLRQTPRIDPQCPPKSGNRIP